ncbi:MAG: alpha/beta hydrolase [Anaerolineae bacterium]
MVVDVAENVAGWLLGQLELLPASMLHDKIFQVPRRVFDQLIGERESQELDALLLRSPAHNEHTPVVLLPGIMGSLLSSVRGISAMLWINPTVILDGHINLLDLDTKGTRDNASDVQITAVGIEKMFYLSLILSLARETCLYEFPYDWRYSNIVSAEQLHLALMRWSDTTLKGNTNRRFVLVGHSMGGMVIRTYLALYPEEAERLISKVILLASPLHGAANAIALFTGSTPTQEIVEHLNPANEMLRLIKSFPSAYELLPPPQSLYTPKRAYPANWDLYDARAWGLPEMHQHHLDAAVRLHQLLASSDPQFPLFQIAGCNLMTMTDIQLTQIVASPTFTPIYKQNGDEGGDDTVPLYSAWDKHSNTFFVTEHHQHIPGNSLVRQAVLDLIYERQPSLPITPVAKSEGLAGMLSTNTIVQQVQELRQRFEKGTFNRDDLAKLFF